MAASPLAGPGDLEARWRKFTAAERTRAAVLLGSASREIRREFNDIDTRIATEAIDPETVVDVACAMAKRAMSRTAGVKASTRHIDAVQVAETYDSVSDDEIYLTDRERSRLTPAAGLSGTGGGLPLYSFPEPSGYPL